MRKRFTWFLLGWLAGTATSAWFQRRVRRTVQRYAPEHLRRQVMERSSAAVEQGVDLVRRVRRIRADIDREDPDRHATPMGAWREGRGHRTSGRHRPVGPVG